MQSPISTYRQNKKISSLITKISKELGVDKSIVLHFVTTDLERILTEKILIHKTKLTILENQFKELDLIQQRLQENISAKETETASIRNRIEELKSSLIEKETNLEENKKTLNQLQSKFDELKKNLTDIEKEKKVVEYKIMMKGHAVKEKTDISFKNISIILTVLTILAVIIAIILIKNK